MWNNFRDWGAFTTAFALIAGVTIGPVAVVVAFIVWVWYNCF